MRSEPATIAVICTAQALALAQEAPTRWLHPLEQARWRQMRSPIRREQWLAGRWWLKHQLLKRWNLNVAPCEVQIVSRDANNLGVAPQALIDDTPLAMALTLSHCDHVIAAAVGPGEPGSCGIDVVDPKSTGTAALQAWITNEDRGESRGGDRCSLVAAWAAKEAAFKTLRGEPFRPGRIALRLATHHGGYGYQGRWRYRRGAEVIQGEVELREHARFVLAIAYRHSLC